VALVTGAARGIGKAIADAMAQNDATVVYTDIDRVEAENSASAWPSATAAEMDVTDEHQVRAVTNEVVDQFGRIDILVNNAGVNTLAHRVPIDQFPREEWDRIVGVDLTGLYIVSKAVVPVMRSQGSGRVINIASVVGLVPLRLQSAFVAAKAAVINVTKSMAIELGEEGILVNAIAPGSILTEGTKQLFYGDDGKFKDSVSRLLEHIPLGRPGTTEEVAYAALFLAAPEASYLNGAILTVDGGWTAGYAREF
jgi:NAD(P)-dependent dehydrogenase (short-subunit alcohol dehydrogenase family)